MNDMTELQKSVLPPVDQIEFGKIFAANMIVAENKNDQWSELRIEPLHNLSLHPATLVFHYGQAIFEGLKAFKRPDGQLALFRPEMNARRLIKSAKRMLFPEIDENTFVDAMKRVVRSNADYVPDQPGSLYLRPTMIGSEAQIGVRGSKEAIFFVLALPSGAYFKSSGAGTKTITVFVDEVTARAARGGTGDVKAAANYAVTLQSIDNAKKKGCDQVVYLDAVSGTHIEEMGGMNIFFFLNNTLVTPSLDGTILPGVTRDSIIQGAKDLGIAVEERPISIQEVKDTIATDPGVEAFACGTAATIVGVNSFMFEDGSKLELPAATETSVTARLLKYIQDIQYGLAPDTHNWITTVE